ncbi:hypothetical protein B0H14DRAFT_2802375, partial [Mycena olivaceomarginata]
TAVTTQAGFVSPASALALALAWIGRGRTLTRDTAYTCTSPSIGFSLGLGLLTQSRVCTAGPPQSLTRDRFRSSIVRFGFVAHSPHSH